MSVHGVVSRREKIKGVEAVVLENDCLRASIVPEIGAKIYQIFWKQKGRDILWQNPRVPLQPYPVESIAGDFWSGGWDDIFPTCDACDFGGLRYPALGELHMVRFCCDELRAEGDTAMARFSAFTPISPIKAEKTVTLDGATLRVHQEITNLAPVPVDFIWGTHPAWRPQPGMVLRIPARKGLVTYSSGPQFGSPGQEYSWPQLSSSDGGATDMSRVYGVEAKGFCGHYVLELQGGWYALEDKETGGGLILSFPRELCPYLWLWLSYGGWRGHWVVIVEPYTSYPVSLADAVRKNTHRQIAPQATFSVEVAISAYETPDAFSQALRRFEASST